MNAVTSGLTAPTTWWRPARAQANTLEPSAAVPTTGGKTAFRALVAFTCILLLSPQAWFPILGPLRIAFLAAGVAIGAHLLDRMLRARDAQPVANEVVIAMLLVAWAVITLPLSYWPAGSLEVLADHYIKAIAFFWLIGSVATTTNRLRMLTWTFVLCSIPLAFTGVKNYLVGKVLYTGVEGFTRIYGYAGGSGLTGNPNDLALMLNLISPLAVALMFTARTFVQRIVAGFALVLCTVAVVVTFSRAGFLALAASILMYMLVLARRRMAGAAAGIMLVGVLALPFLPAGYLDRLSTITEIDADATGSAKGRWEDTKVAVGVMAANAVMGVGMGQNVLALNEERGETWRKIHNVYLEYGVDLGVPGMLLFLWLYFRCFKAARAVERRAAADPARRELAHLAAGVQVSLVAFGVAAFFHPIAYQFYFFSIAGLAVALKHTWRAEAAARHPAPVHANA